MNTVLRISLVVCVVLFCGMQRVSGQWVQTGFGNLYDTQALAVSGATLFSGTNYGVFLSTDEGRNWKLADSGFVHPIVYSLAVVGSKIIAGAIRGAYLSTDNGASWSVVDSGLPNIYNLHLQSFISSGASLFAGTNYGIYRLSKSGDNWTPVDLGQNHPSVESFAVNGDNLYAGTDTDGVYVSTDTGSTWTQSGLLKKTIHALAVCGSWLFAGTDSDGVFVSSNNGYNWTAIQAGLSHKLVYSLVVRNGKIFMGSLDGVSVSSDSGFHWISMNEGIEHGGVNAFAFDDQNVFVSVKGWDIFRRPLSEITGIGDQHNEIPSAFTLHQNYPNPFSPSTTISFTIPSSSFVSLKIFDALGKEVSTLVSGDLDPGLHSCQWNASGLWSGVYLCRLQAGDKVATHKLSLLR